MKKHSMTDTSAAARLLSGIERIERLEEERKALAEDIRDIKAQLKSAGFDIKVISQMLKERRMSAADRQEWQALCDVYRAALGMLDGTPLGDHTRSRILGLPVEPDPETTPPNDGAEPDDAELPAEPAIADPGAAGGAKQPQEATAEEMLTARAEGGAAALAGKTVTSNPYPAGDVRRASWDEGWCASAGSDGMEIPAAFRRSTEKKPKGGSGKGTGS